MHSPHGVRLASALASALAIASALASLPVAALELDEIPLPDDATLEVVGVNLLQNGRPLSIGAFRTAREVEDVIAWYRETWPGEDDAPGHVESAIGGWRTIAHLDPRENAQVALQLQVATGGGATGFLSVLSLEPIRTTTAPPPMPSGASLISDTVSQDGLLTSRASLLNVSGRPATVAAFYRDAMTRSGWHIARDAGDANPAVLLFTRADGRAELTVNDARDGGSFVVLNIVTRGR